VDWVEYEFLLTDQSKEKIAKAAELISKRYNLHMFTGSKNDLLKVAPQIFEVIDEAYRKLYGTVPLTDAQVQGYINSYFGLANPEYIPIVMDENNRVVAFGITFPSFSKALQKSHGDLFPFGFIHFLRAMQKNDRADLYLIGIRDEYRSRGVNALVMNQVYTTFLKHGIKYVESNPNLELNLDVQAMWKYFQTRQHKRRRCYVKHIG
jgi:GNAT superfamily N-acetyltransferase